MAEDDNGRHGLTDRQDAAIAALLAADTVVAAARQAKVSERHLRRWLGEDAAFRAELRRARAEVRAGVVRAVVRRGVAAARALGAVLKSGPPAASVAAARVILDVIFRDEDGDREQLLFDLERRLGVKDEEP